MNILVLGGDARQLYLAKALNEEGFSVALSGFDADGPVATALPCRREEEISRYGYDMVILPLPVTKDDIYLNAPLFHRPISLETVLRRLSSKQIVVGGMFSPYLKQAFSDAGIQAWDYAQREEFAVRNAVPTAEGAIAIAMNETPFTLHGAACLVVGNGRIGKVLAKMLSGIGAKVTVSARKCEDMAWICTNSYHALPTDQIARWADRFDIIFNTVPHPVLHGEVLRKVKKDCLLIDLASKPGGIEVECAKTLGLNTIWALSLPGAVAPETAGIIMKDTILNICNELGV